jgi:WD40 repeat protein
VIISGGSDGNLYIWDIQKKDRLKQFNFPDNTITSLAVSHDGKYLVFSTGYDWSMGFYNWSSKHFLSLNLFPLDFINIPKKFI